MTTTLDAPLTTNPRLQIQGELFAADCFRRPPSMPQFRDEPEMPKQEPKIHRPDKLPEWRAPAPNSVLARAMQDRVYWFPGGEKVEMLELEEAERQREGG